MDGPVRLVGAGRDLLTDSDGTAHEVGTGWFDTIVDVSRGHVITSIEASPAVDGLDTLVGARARGGFRKVLNQLAAAHDIRGSVLFQLLDDVAGATLVSAYAPQLAVGSHDLEPRDPEGAVQVMLGMVDICAGWRTGGTPLSSLAAGGAPSLWLGPEAPSWVVPDDPLAWHDLPVQDHGSMRRARRLDLAPTGSDDDSVRVDAGFRDTHVDGDGRTTIVHEYTLTAEVEVAGLVVAAIAAEPRVLPYRECPEAAASPRSLVGSSLVGVRDRVRTELTGPSTCTHLHDVLRSLEDVGRLADVLLAA